MRSLRRPIATPLAALLVIGTTVRASAQTDDRVHLVLESDRADTIYDVRSSAGDPPFAFECRAPCDRLVPRGRYFVAARSLDDAVPSQDASLDVGEDRRVYTTSGSRTGKDVGLVLGIVGIAATVVGAAGLLASWPGNCEDKTADQCQHMNDVQNRKETAFGLVLIGGLASTITGWIVFGVHRTTIDVRPPRAASGVAFAVAPVPGGASFGFVGAF